MGNFMKYINVLKRVRASKKMEVLALGGSITAGGYYVEFVNRLVEKEQLNVTVHNHGHGATEITCELLHVFCVLFCEDSIQSVFI
jgi:hypothetical protein